MKYETITDIYSANQKIRNGLERLVEDLDNVQATTLPEGEKWSIKQIVEHISIVDLGRHRICSKLLAGAEAANKPSNGALTISANLAAQFAAVADVKLEAPERVQPTGDVSIHDSLAKMLETGRGFAEIRPKFEKYDLTEHKFPHPYFGDLTAAEWLIIAGGHELRHTRQIERLLAKIRK